MAKKQIIFVVLSSLILGAIGSWIFTRAIVPKLNTIKWLVRYNLAPSSGPLVINTREEIRINDGSDTVAAIQTAEPWLVGIISAPDLNHAQLLGGGLMLTSDGLVVTTKSVLAQNPQLYVKFSDGKTFSAKLVATDPSTALIFLKIDSSNLPTASFGSPTDMQLGQKIIILSAQLDQYQFNDQVSYLQSTFASWQDTRVYSSDVINSTFTIGTTGTVIEGAAVMSNDAKIQGLYSKDGIITSDAIQSALSNYFANANKITRNSYGLHYEYIPAPLASILHLRAGVEIKRPDEKTPAVIVGSPASQAGILEGDLIYKVDGTQIDYNNSFETLINKHKPNETVELELLRGKEDKVINLIVKAK